ncbi:MAG: hypothetical protein VX154_00180 [Pseudomonadota bacterium]|nr:hypothetical protein [Pseudomonadota bacterium]
MRLPIISNIIDIYKQSVAAIIIRKALDESKELGVYNGDSKKMSEYLMSQCWLHAKHIVNGSREPRPQDITLAAMALSAIIETSQDKSKIEGVTFTLMRILSFIEQNPRSSDFKAIDRQILSTATEICMEATPADIRGL